MVTPRRLLGGMLGAICLGICAIGWSGETVLNGEKARLLLVGDPFAKAVEHARSELETLAGGRIEIEIVGYNDVRRMALANKEDQVSKYDVLSFDVVWMGEYASKGILLPLNKWIAATPEVDPADFLEAAYRAASSDGVQYGLPIQPHSELLWYRTDLFEAANLPPPTTTDELLTAAKIISEKNPGIYGLCWNAQRGQPLGQTVAHLYAAFGQPLLDEKGFPTLNTPKAVAMARFLLELKKIAPPDILAMAWDQRIQRFAKGKAAMTYGWGARSFLAEEDPTSVVKGKVGYIAPPHAPGAKPVVPLGTWSLGIPANIGEREALAWRFLAWFTSPKILKLLAHHGNGGTPRYSVIRDPELRKRYPTFAVMDQLGQEGRLDDSMRPAVPQWADLCEILGTVYHDMLRGKLTPEEAVAEAQKQAEALFRP